MEKDTDGDGAEDGVDKTLNDKNPPINYIVYFADGYRTIHANAYVTAFKLFNMKSEKIIIYTNNQFKQLFENLDHGVESVDKNNIVFNSDSRYSYVENIIICVHGGIYFTDAYMNFMDQGLIAPKIADLFSGYCPPIRIKTIDLQVCHGGYYDSQTKGIAIELLKATHAEAVYGADTDISFLGLNFGFTFLFWIKENIINIVITTKIN